MNKRVRPKPAIQLPVASLLQQFTTNPSVMVKNFTLIYIEMGFERIPLEVHQGDRLAKMLVGRHAWILMHCHLATIGEDGCVASIDQRHFQTTSNSTDNPDPLGSAGMDKSSTLHLCQSWIRAGHVVLTCEPSNNIGPCTYQAS